MKNTILEAAHKAHFNPEIIRLLEDYQYPETPQTNPFNKLDQFENYNEQERFAKCLDAAYLLLIKLREKDIPDHILYPSFANFNHHIMKYYNNHQDLGIYQKDIKWLNLLFTEKIFKVHNLRFQIFPMDYEEMERSGYDYLELSKEQKERFPIDYPLINVHIETNTDLSPQSVEDSFKQANEFFSTYYPEFKYTHFICRTWILHPSLDLLLDKNTNLVQFKNRFDVIATSQNYIQALERIYGTADFKKIEAMPKQGRLQTQAYKIYQKLGVGIGIIDKETFND